MGTLHGIGEVMLAQPAPSGLRVEASDAGLIEAVVKLERRGHPTPWPRQHLLDSLSHHHCWGVWNEAELIAHAIVSCAGGEAELLLLVVDPAWQGRGVGKALLRGVIAALVGAADMLFLEVRVSNARARHRYESVGFNEMGVRRNYYRDGPRGPEDACLYALDLLCVDT